MFEDGEFIAAITSLIAFYVLIIVIGIVSSCLFRKKYGVAANDIQYQLVAGRTLGPVVGVLTMSATLVGGGFLNGTAESVRRDGLVWTLAPFGIFLGLIIGGLVYAEKMRNMKYTTMLDPFEEKYGLLVTSMFFPVTMFGDVLWSGAILSALGTSLSVIIGLNVYAAVIVSAGIAVFYTLIGQMVSVAYTDIAELVLLTVGMVLCVPFAISHQSVPSILSADTSWLGSIPAHRAGLWTDLAITMTLGSIPWQSYFQRVLSVRFARDAKLFSVIAGFSALVLVIPPILLGYVGASVDWNSTAVPQEVYSDVRLTLPLVIKTFTPVPVRILGLGAIAAAVMSSCDSAILGSSSMFTHNIYHRLRPKASPLELSIILKAFILLVGVLSTCIALFAPSMTIYGLFIMAADIVFVAILPPLTCSLFVPVSNGYGAMAGYLLGLILRLGAGETTLGLPSFIAYPYYDEVEGQLFPFRTFSMLCSMIAIVTISSVAQIIVRYYPKLDVLNSLSRSTHLAQADECLELGSHSSPADKLPSRLLSTN